MPPSKKDKQSSKPLLPARYGQDPFEYAAALAKGKGPVGVHATPVPEQRPSNANQPCHNCPRVVPMSIANPLTFKFELPTSFEYARQAAIQPISHCSCGASSTSMGPVEQVEGPTLDELRTLSRWPRLHDQTLPPPTVGAIESDPSGIADRFGMKGLPVLTAFVNPENLSCRVCSFKAKTVELAVFHQQQVYHFQT